MRGNGPRGRREPGGGERVVEDWRAMSLWLEGQQRIYPPLDRDASADVAIVGGGVAGIACAYFLASAGLRPVVLEARGVAEAASGRNAGFLLAGVAESFVAASRRYGEERAWRVWGVTRRTQTIVRELVARHAIDCELRWNGSDQIAGDDQEWREIDQSARRLCARGVVVTTDASRRAATYADDGELHPVRWVRGLAAAAVDAGARIHEGTAVASVEPGGVATTAGGPRIHAAAVLLCTNAYTGRLCGSRIRAVRGQMLATAPAARVFERPAYADRGYRYWRQTPDGRVVVGGWRNTALAQEVGEDETPTPGIQARLDEFLAANGISARVTHRWAGTMGFSHDGLPYVGQTDARLYVCAGFTGHGMAFGPACAEIAASLVRGVAHPDADLFQPGRA